MDLRAGPHHARRDGCDENILTSQFRPQCIGQTDQRKLAGSIGSHVRDSDFSTDRGDVDDATSAARSHFRDDLHDQLERRPKMHAHAALEILALHVFERADFDDAGIVN